jgi:transposase
MRRVGIDLALRSDHQAVVVEDGVRIGKSFPVKRTKAGVDELERRATAGADGPCEFTMEPTGFVWLPLAAELERRGHRIYLPKPQKTNALRKFYSVYAKTDRIDAAALALVRHVDPEGVYELRVPTATESSLRLEVKHRAQLVGEAAESKRRIQSWLVLGNPHLSDALGGEFDSRLGRALLRECVNPFEVITKGQGRLRKLWCRHVRGAVDQERFDAIWRACETTAEMYDALRTAGKLPFAYQDLQDLVHMELDHIEFIEGQVARVEAKITSLYRQLDPERTLEREVPGVGEAIAPTIEALVGDVERFPNAKSFVSYLGLVPRTRQTGGRQGKSRQRLTKGGPNLLKQYMFLAAETARRQDPELATTYERATKNGKHHFSAVIIVAHKLARKIYAVLKLRAAARRARAEGQNADQIPVVSYQIRHPQDGTPMSRQEARAYVTERFPSKAALAAAKKRAARTTSQKTGSSSDATKGTLGGPPTSVAQMLASAGGVDNPVDNHMA